MRGLGVVGVWQDQVDRSSGPEARTAPAANYATAWRPACGPGHGAVHGPAREQVRREPRRLPARFRRAAGCPRHYNRAPVCSFTWTPERRMPEDDARIAAVKAALESYADPY